MQAGSSVQIPSPCRLWPLLHVLLRLCILSKLLLCMIKVKVHGAVLQVNQ